MLIQNVTSKSTFDFELVCAWVRGKTDFCVIIALMLMSGLIPELGREFELGYSKS